MGFARGSQASTAAIPLLIFAVLIAGGTDPRQARGEEPDAAGPMMRVVDTLNPTNWSLPPFLKMPKFSGILPAKQDRMRITKKKDSLVDDVTQTASQSWQRTKQALSPQNLNPVKFFPASAKSESSSKPDDQPGFFRSLFAPPPPPQRPNTVTDFLGQAKPRG